MSPATRTLADQALAAPAPAHRGEPARARRTAAIALVAALGWACSLTLSVRIETPPTWQQVALFGHLASVVAGLGAVLAVDFHALQWLLGRRSLRSVLTVAAGLTPLIWVGFVGLLATGALLAPDLSNPLTDIKLGLVLLVGLNGAYAGHMHTRMTSVSEHNARVNFPATISAAISQIGWWGAVLIGFLSTQV
jgi:hypothetical protein